MCILASLTGLGRIDAEQANAPTVNLERVAVDDGRSPDDELCRAGAAREEDQQKACRNAHGHGRSNESLKITATG